MGRRSWCTAPPGAWALRHPDSPRRRCTRHSYRGSDNQATLEALGVDVAVDYTNANLAEVVGEETGGIGVDAVLDTVGGDTILFSIQLTRPFGRMATILGAQGDLTPMYQKNQTL